MTARGTTLLELIVALTILGLLAALSAAQLRAVRGINSGGGDSLERIAINDTVRALRVRAVTSRTVQHAAILVSGRAWLVSAWPDGAVVSDAPIGLDPATGEVIRAAR